MNSPYPEHSQATTALVLGILGIFFSILAPFAWYIGNEEVKAIDAGRRPPENRSNAQTGKILGMAPLGHYVYAQSLASLPANNSMLLLSFANA